MTKNRKTVLRTIKIPYEIDQILQKDAKAKRVSTNSLIHNLLLKYTEWDRYSERFGRVVLSPQTLQLIIDSLNDTYLNGQRIEKEIE